MGKFIEKTVISPNKIIFLFKISICFDLKFGFLTQFAIEWYRSHVRTRVPVRNQAKLRFFVLKKPYGWCRRPEGRHLNCPGRPCASDPLFLAIFYDLQEASGLSKKFRAWCKEAPRRTLGGPCSQIMLLAAARSTFC